MNQELCDYCRKQLQRAIPAYSGEDNDIYVLPLHPDFTLEEHQPVLMTMIQDSQIHDYRVIDSDTAAILAVVSRAAGGDPPAGGRNLQR